MNKRIIQGVLLVALLFSACSKDTDDKLEGKWQLQEVTVNNVTEKVDTVFYNFQNTLFQYQIYDKKTDRYPVIYGYKTLLENNNILLEMTYPEKSIDAFLPRTDWETKEKTFTINELSGDKLVLYSDGKIYSFRKF